jgi:hypothetical protein
MPVNLRTAEVNGRLWGVRARDWTNNQEGTVRPVYEAVPERTRVASGTRYLDVGCGAGMAAQVAAMRGAQVSGIDAAEALLAIAPQCTPEGDFPHGDLEELPFDDRSFDVVAVFNSFQYAGNPVVALREARRVNRPGGVVVIGPGQPGRDGSCICDRRLAPAATTTTAGWARPFALFDEQALRKFTVDAGFSTSTAHSSTQMRPRRYAASTPPASRRRHGAFERAGSDGGAYQSDRAFPPAQRQLSHQSDVPLPAGTAMTTWRGTMATIRGRTGLLRSNLYVAHCRRGRIGIWQFGLSVARKVSMHEFNSPTTVTGTPCEAKAGRGQFIPFRILEIAWVLLSEFGQALAAAQRYESLKYGPRQVNFARAEIPRRIFEEFYAAEHNFGPEPRSLSNLRPK